MRSKRRAVQAALFAMEEATVREIASVAECTEGTARRHLSNLFYEEMASLRQETCSGRRSWWVNVWFLTEKGREILGPRKIIEEDVERMVLGGMPKAGEDCTAQDCGLTSYITTGSAEVVRRERCL